MSILGIGSSDEASELIVYSVFKAPISYVGEIHSQDEKKIVMKRVLLLFQGSGEQVSIMPQPFASRDSKLTIDKTQIPGIIIDQIDEDLKSMYKKEIFAAYSKLKVSL